MYPRAVRRCCCTMRVATIPGNGSVVLPLGSTTQWGPHDGHGVRRSRSTVRDSRSSETVRSEMRCEPLVSFLSGDSCTAVFTAVAVYGTVRHGLFFRSLSRGDHFWRMATGSGLTKVLKFSPHSRELMETSLIPVPIGGCDGNRVAGIISQNRSLFETTTVGLYDPMERGFRSMVDLSKLLIPGSLFSLNFAGMRFLSSGHAPLEIPMCIVQLYRCATHRCVVQRYSMIPQKRQEGGKLESPTHVCSPQPPSRTRWGGAFLDPTPTRWLRPFSRRSPGQPRRVRLFATSMAPAPPPPACNPTTLVAAARPAAAAVAASRRTPPRPRPGKRADWAAAWPGCL